MRMRNRIKSILREELLKENDKTTLTLFHGTCEHNAKELMNNGWEPSNEPTEDRTGQPHYLYLTSHPSDAMWFAEEKGCDKTSVVQVKNVPIEYLKPDPEDEAGFTMEELLDRLDKGMMPAKFVLTKPLDASHFSLHD